ncbi:MAG: hypothetical protein RLZZ293_156, partial [Pseudomonadota bacterium]
SLVEYSYVQNNTNYTGAEVVNYQYFQANQFSGVHFSGAVEARGSLGTTSYVTAYLFAGGDNGSHYLVNLKSSLASIKTENGFQSGGDLAANQVQAVELAVPISLSVTQNSQIVPEYTSYTTQRSSLTKQQLYTSGSALTVTVIPVQSAPNLVFGQLPILQVPNGESQTLNVINNGNAVSGAITISVSDDSISYTKSANCDSLLANAANSCQITFDSSALNTESALVTFTANGKNYTQTIYSINNGDNHPVIAIISSEVAESGISVEIGDETESFITTFTNTGELDLESVNVIPSSNAAADFITESDTCSGKTLASGSQCIVKGYIRGNYSGTGLFYFSVTGSSQGKSYGFSSAQWILNVTATFPYLSEYSNLPTSLTLVSPESYVYRVYNLVNIGKANGTISYINLATSGESNLVAAPAIESGLSGDCSIGLSLAPNATCQVRVKYGASNTAAIASNQTGTATLVVTIKDPRTLINYTVGNAFAYIFKGNDSTLVLESMTATNLMGNGLESSPYIASAATSSNALITLTYKNPSVNYVMKKLSFDVASFPFGYQIESSSTCPTALPNDLDKGATCQLKLQINPNYLTQVASSYNNLKFTPRATWSTGPAFLQESTDQVFVDYYKPVVSTVASKTSGYYESTTLSVVATGLESSGYSASGLTAQISGGQSTIKQVYSSNCSSSGCTFGGGSPESGSLTYYLTNDITGSTQNLNFNLANSTGYAYFNPNSLYLTMTMYTPWQVLSKGFSTGIVSQSAVTTDGTGRVFVATLEDCSNNATDAKEVECYGRLYRRGDNGQFTMVKQFAGRTSLQLSPLKFGKLLLIGGNIESDVVYIAYSYRNTTGASYTYIPLVYYWNGKTDESKILGIGPNIGSQTTSSGTIRGRWDMALYSESLVYLVGMNTDGYNNAMKIYQCFSNSSCSNTNVPTFGGGSGSTITGYSSNIRNLAVNIAVSPKYKQLYMSVITARSDSSYTDGYQYLQNFTVNESTGALTAGGFNSINNGIFPTTLGKVNGAYGFTSSAMINPIFGSIPFFTIDNNSYATSGLPSSNSSISYCSNCVSSPSAAPSRVDVLNSNSFLYSDSHVLISYATGSVYVSGESAVSIGANLYNRLVIRTIGSINSTGNFVATNPWTDYGYANGESVYGGIAGFPSAGPATTSSIGILPSSNGSNVGSSDLYIDNVTSNRYAVFSDPSTAPAGKATLTGLILINK